MARKINYGSMQELDANLARKAGEVPFRGMLVMMRVKAIEEESRQLIQDVIRCETRFAKMDLEKGIKLCDIISEIKTRYSERFQNPIIEALEKEFKR